ncbi:MAG: N-acetylmuramoyl-L-alanine amidase [Actinobacteria bacterium]|nr:MAG: N-acetylmuramoyl-L-alanine amidase [Actinomycetota bacterium]
MLVMETLARGARGEAVLDIQTRLGSLGYPIDPSEHAWFGEATERAVRRFQERRHLIVNGVVDEHTWGELVEAGYSVGDRILYLRYPYFRGDDVRDIQASLNLLGFDAGREDGIFGERTDRAVHEFQRNVGLPPDGIVGVTTVEALSRLRPVGPGPGRAEVREAEALRRLSASIRGARIAIDPGHGPGDAGTAGPGGLSEADLSILLSEAVSGELGRRGAVPFLLRGADEDPSAGERAARANQLGVEVLIAIHAGTDDDPATSGASSFYFGREGWHSQAGRRLAELIQQELAREGRPDRGAHPKSLSILRETQMPAVHVEPCFITNPEEERLLADGSFRQRIAAALATAVERFFAGAPAVEASASGPAGTR